MKIALSVSEKERAKGSESLYFKALVAVGVQPEELEPLTAAGSSLARPVKFDGLLLAGGEDVDPTLYGEEKKYQSVDANRARDFFEQGLLDRALRHRLPILGICRGAQLINVKFGGTLYQDLAKDVGPEFEHRQTEIRSETVHTVTLTDPESRLAEDFRGSCRVNSLHHQAIKRLGRGLKVTAHSEDGLVEAVEAADDYPFLLAVQWHPEEITTQSEQRRIFEQFVSACRQAAARSGPGSRDFFTMNQGPPPGMKPT
jgi:putative glutamine amidotransferase